MVDRWCPSVAHVVGRVDGGLARVRIPGGRIRAGQLAVVARAAHRLGTDVIEITNRANLQLRGVAPAAVGRMAADLVDAGLSAGATGDLRRNILANPLAGLDPGEVTDVSLFLPALLEGLDADRRLDALSAKFGVILDGGGRWHLGGRRDDAVVRAVRAPGGELRFEIRVPGQGVYVAAAAEVADVVVTAAVASIGRPVRRLVTSVGPAGPVAVVAGAPGMETASGSEAAGGSAAASGSEAAGQGATVAGGQGADGLGATVAVGPIGIGRQVDPGRRWVGAMPVLGRMDGPTADAVAVLAERYAGGRLRLTPWRGLVLGDVPAPEAPTVLAALRRLGLLTEPADPGTAVVACTGCLGCTSGLTDASGDALAVIEARQQRRAAPLPVHVSGCEKRCAHRAPTPVTLLGVGPGRYDVLVADPAAPGGERRLVAGLDAPTAVALAARIDAPAAATRAPGAATDPPTLELTPLDPPTLEPTPLERTPLGAAGLQVAS